MADTQGGPTAETSLRKASPQRHMPPLNRAEGKVVSQLQDKLELLVIHFASKGRRISFVTTFREDSEICIKTLEISKSPGPGEMNLLQNDAEEPAHPLTYLTTKCMAMSM